METPDSLELDAILPVPAVNARHLAPHLIRFELPGPRPLSPYIEQLLAGNTSAGSILPEAPNRSGIQQMHDRTWLAFEKAFGTTREEPLVRLLKLDTFDAFVRFHVAQLGAPTFVYTNGQRLLTIRRWEQDLWTLAHHTIEAFVDFSSALAPTGPLDLAEIAPFRLFSAAESAVHSALARLEVKAVLMTRGDERGSLLLQEAGRRWTPGGWDQQRIAHFRGNVVRLRSVNEEPHALLRRLEIDGFRPRTCARCVHFRFSGMSRDSSGGARGYCTPRNQAAQASGASPVGPWRALVSVFDTCEDHTTDEP